MFRPRLHSLCQFLRGHLASEDLLALSERGQNSEPSPDRPSENAFDQMALFRAGFM